MIELKEVTKVFDTRGIAGLHGINLTIKRGEIIALLGPNGSGKTTLANIISQNLDPDSGSVKIDEPVHQFKLRELPFDLNVQKYLISQINLEIDDEKKIQLVRDLASLFEFTFQLRQNTHQLSQGQRQKIMLAAELINSPAVIIMDEPFAHLDPLSRKEILTELFNFLRHKEITSFWISHDKDEAFEYADKIGLLQHGKLEQFARPDEFIKHPRNLFVAHFLGHRNFLAIKKSSTEWITPWGKINSPLKDEEAYLVIPPTAFTLNHELGTEVKILRSYSGPLFWKIEMAFEAHIFEAWTNQALSPDRSKYHLMVNLEDCFLLPL
jgi:ABC-type Fe3+/spermidine/putrescine transport system ATPase subunit